ncbi:LLM class flavin-dependent oxidoreductase [Saccharopolyspora spinosa]|uniref:5,10-methylenetetrahydromethanopterin reductase n=1 Tax=Saccharopolyspora spinosa TaxID=60894 RepID=A0A2N3Y1M4_SACSN|nr:LLM class flavin-dependent oxidoreductase [Saccharopolyspora spinosa]PKW16838.1 5,10-methylenetetrahydromethanopterin reductase [Saccharopolyspora spinosa]
MSDGSASATTHSTLPHRGLVVYPSEPASQVLELTRTAEELGYSHVWIGDSQNNWREAAALLGAAAVSTSTVVLGTGVTNVVTRHQSVFASMWATVSELSSGRAAVGVGTGFTALGSIGHKPVPLKTLETRIREFRDLTGGRSVTDDVTATEYRLDYLVGSPRRIPVYVAASGPKALRTAGRVGDGVILLIGTAPEVITEALSYVREGAEESGRSLADIDVVLWTEIAMGDDPVRARDHVRGPVARMVMRWLPLTLPERIVPGIEHVRTFAAEYEGNYYGHKLAKAEHAREVTDEVVDAFSLAGTPAEIERRLSEFAAVGVDQVAVVPAYGTNWADRIETVRAFASVGQDPR